MSEINRPAPGELMSQQGGGPATAGLSARVQGTCSTGLPEPEPLPVQDLLNQSMHFQREPRVVVCMLKSELLCSLAGGYRDQRRGQGSGNTEEPLESHSFCGWSPA